MRIFPKMAILACTCLLQTGCIARTALDVVTAPVKIAGGAVDATTTSQSEADEKRGRDMRKRDEKLGKLERRYRDLADDCSAGNDTACRDAVAVRSEIDNLQAYSSK